MYILIILFMVVFASCGGDGSEGHHSLQVEYDYYELALSQDWLQALPFSINNGGVVVGMGYHSNRNTGFSYSNGYYSEIFPQEGTGHLQKISMTTVLWQVWEVQMASCTWMVTIQT